MARDLLRDYVWTGLLHSWLVQMPMSGRYVCPPASAEEPALELPLEQPQGPVTWRDSSRGRAPGPMENRPTCAL